MLCWGGCLYAAPGLRLAWVWGGNSRALSDFLGAGYEFGGEWGVAPFGQPPPG